MRWPLKVVMRHLGCRDQDGLRPSCGPRRAIRVYARSWSF